MRDTFFTPNGKVLLAVLAVFAMARILELIRSKANLRFWLNRVQVVQEALFPWMVALHLLFFMLLPLEALFRPLQLGGQLSIISAGVVLGALLLRIWTLRTLGPSWNVRLVKGQEIVTTGPYRYIRHPNYLVVFLELLFVPLVFHLFFSAALLTLGNIFVLTLRIRSEEFLLRSQKKWQEEMASKPSGLPWIP